MTYINQVSVRSGRKSSFFSTGSVPFVVFTLFLTVVTLTNQANAQRAIPSPIVDICLAFSDNCPSCISTASCGFCQDTGLCLTGDVNGPGGNPNNCTDWFFLECPASPCSAFTSCRQCVADSLCGWCFDTLLCVPGSISGPITGICRNFVFGNRNLCNSPSPSRSRSRRPQKTTGRVSTTGTASTTGKNSKKPNKTTGKNKTSQKINRSTGNAPSRSNSPSNSLLATTSAASYQKPIYLLFYILLALSSISMVVARF